MSRRRRSKQPSTEQARQQQTPQPNIEQADAGNGRYDIVVLAVLLAVGGYFSVIYFAHQPVPNPDFTAFTDIGHQLLSFNQPASYKRVPVFGIMIAAVSHIVGGHHPDLTAGWVINAVLYPMCGVLLWRIAKKIVAAGAEWIALIVMMNPYVLGLVSEPIAEITLLFFVLLTCFLMLKGSRWCYLAASVTMMVRYEGAALILAGFVLDMIERKGKKEKIKSLICAAAASVPLMVWMYLTYTSGKEMGQTHYLNEMGEGGAFGDTFVKYLNLMWQVSAGTLFAVRPDGSKGLAEFVANASKVVLAAGFLFGCVWSIVKKQWKIPALLIFLVPYYIIHVLHSFVLARFCIIVFWMVILVAVYGLQSAWAFVKLPKSAKVILQSVLIAAVIAWTVSLLGTIPKLAAYSPKSAGAPYVLTAAVLVLFVGYSVIFKARRILGKGAVAAVLTLMVVSSQFTLVRVVGLGMKHIEFKMLAKWYVEEAEPGAKMACALPNVLNIYAPKHKGAFVHFSSIQADSPEDFVRICYKRKIKYVAWDSVGGMQVGGRYYKLWGFKNIAVLSRPKSIGPYEFVTQIKASDRQYINVFRLKEIGDGSQAP